MNFKTTYILFGVLAAVVGVFALMLVLNPAATENQVYVLPTAHNEDGTTVDTSKIASVKLERVRPTAETLAFERTADGKGWRMTAPVAWRADSFAVDQLIRQVFDARREKFDGPNDLKQYELDPPAAVITVTGKDGQSWSMNLGRELKGETMGQVFVTSSDEPKQPMAIKTADADQLFKKANDFRSKDLLSESLSDINGIRLQPSKGQAIAFSKKDETHWRFQEPKDFGPADYDGPSNPSPDATDKTIRGVRALVEAVNNLRLESDADFVADHVTDWKKYGIGTDSFQITAQRKDNDPTAKDTLLIGKKTDAKGAQYYARLAGTDSVLKLDAKKIDPLLTLPSRAGELRSHDLADVEETAVDALDVTNKKGTLHLRKMDGKWKMFDAAGKAAATDSPSVEDLVKTLTARRSIQSFVSRSEQSKLGFTKPSAVSVSLWTHSIEEKKPAKADKKAAKKPETMPTPKGQPAVQLRLVRKDHQTAYAEVKAGPDTIVATVAESLYAKANQDRLAYLDRTLPTFPVDAEPIRLALKRDGKTYELTHDSKTKTWSYKQPGHKKATTADAANVDAIIRELRDLRATKLVSEKPSKKELSQYGLGKIEAKLVFRQADKKTAERTYQFGNKTNDGVYAQESGTDLVFVVDPFVAQALDGELRDRAIFHFTPDKVTAIRFTGWKSVYKHDETLELKREADKTWKATKAPSAGFKPDTAQVDDFLRRLTSSEMPLIERFLDGPPKPDYDLAPEKRTLQIELTVTGTPGPVTLTLGKLDTKTHAYYAQSSVAPGMVFTLPEDRLGQLTSGADALSSKGK